MLDSHSTSCVLCKAALCHLSILCMCHCVGLTSPCSVKRHCVIYQFCACVTVLDSPRRSIDSPSLRESHRKRPCRPERSDDRETHAAPRDKTDGRFACCHGLYLDRLVVTLFTYIHHHHQKMLTIKYFNRTILTKVGGLA